MFAQVKNKTTFCLLIITLFTSFFFARSVVVREQWIVPTFLSDSPHQDVTASALAYTNNWLKEGILKLHLGRYVYPASIEMETLDKRYFYASYPPGSILPVFLLFKTLDVTGIIPDIYSKRGAQLLLLILYNYLIHFTIALLLCYMAFFLCLKLGFDPLNSTIFGLVPAIIQFHNANSLYHHQILYNMELAIMLPFVVYVFLEFLRISYTSARVSLVVQVLQPLLMFFGVLIDWFFVFVILAVYTIRIIRKEVEPPISLNQGLLCLKQSFLFFAPALAAVGVWGYQVTYYLQNIAHGNLIAVARYGAEETKMSLFAKILERVGIADGIDYYLYYLKTAFVTHIQNGYGLAGLVVIYAALWAATLGRKFMQDDNDNTKQATVIYLMFLVPSIIYNLFFLQHSYDHIFSSIKFSPALSLAFILLPIFILQIFRKDHLLKAVRIMDTRNVSLATVIAISSSMLYGYVQIHDKNTVTKMFSRPDYSHVVIGDFIKANIDYEDVVFSNFYYVHSAYTKIHLHFTNKVIHPAHNLDHIYYKVKSIEHDFTINILHKGGSEVENIRSFLAAQKIDINNIQEEEFGLLSFNGKDFRVWYERVHECNKYPQRCEMRFKFQ